MDYHLHCDGQSLGVFPLRELHQRRNAGELTGQEFVWREGMADWATLNSVLEAAGLGPGPIPPPIPAPVRRPNNLWLLWSLLGIGLLVLFCLTVLGPGIVRFTKALRHGYHNARSGGFGASVALAARPIPVNSNALTEASSRLRAREFRVRQYIQGYQRNGDHSVPWDRKAYRLMDAWLAANYGGPASQTSPAALADQLMKLPDFNDPLLLTVAAANASDPRERDWRLERALAGFDHSQYRAYPKFYATVLLSIDLGTDAAQVRSLDQRAAGYFAQAFSDGSFEPGDEPELGEILVDGWGRGFFQRNAPRVCEVVRQAKAYPWLMLVLQGQEEVGLAWQARGSGYANSVSSKGWAGFNAHLATARSELTGAWQLQPDRPLAPSLMITVAMGQSNPQEMRTWFDRALEAQIDYPYAWSNFRWGLRPRWFGSQQALLALGFGALHTKRFDTDVPRKLFDCIGDVEAEQKLPAGRHLYGRVDLWPRLQQMYEGYLAEPSQAQFRAGWRSTYAAVAYLAGQYEVARRQLELLHWEPVRQNLTGWGTDLSLMPLKVAALTGNTAGEARLAESCYERRDLTTALEDYRELSSSAQADPRTRQFSLCRLEALRQEQLLAKGDWVDLLPSGTNDPNWVVQDGELQPLPDGGVEFGFGARGYSLYCRTRIGPEFEVKGEFEWVGSSNRRAQANLVMGLPDNRASEWYAFRLLRNLPTKPLACFSRGWTAQAVAHRATFYTGPNTFRFRLQGGKADAWVNEQQVLQKACPTRTLNLGSDCLLGLAASGESHDYSVRYRSLKVRRLRPQR